MKSKILAAAAVMLLGGQAMAYAKADAMVQTQEKDTGTVMEASVQSDLPDYLTYHANVSDSVLATYDLTQPGGSFIRAEGVSVSDYTDDNGVKMENTLFFIDDFN